MGLPDPGLGAAVHLRFGAGFDGLGDDLHPDRPGCV